MIQNLLFKLTLFSGSGKEGVGGWWVVKISVSQPVGIHGFLPCCFYLHMAVKKEGSGVEWPCLCPSSGI